MLNLSRIFFSISLLCALMFGCTKIGTSVNVGHSGFDNARTVSISPHASAGIGPIYLGLGAQWNASNPDTVILIVAVFFKYTGITGAELNIDGEKVSLTQLSSSSTDMDNSGGFQISKRGFASDIAIVKKITASKRTWLRLHTPTGYIEDAVIDGAKDSKAYNALIRFITAVEAK